MLILDKRPTVNRRLAPDVQAQPIGILGPYIGAIGAIGAYKTGPKVKTWIYSVTPPGAPGAYFEAERRSVNCPTFSSVGPSRWVTLLLLRNLFLIRFMMTGEATFVYSAQEEEGCTE